jgi:Xaa-Pro aminopeptidase
MNAPASTNTTAPHLAARQAAVRRALAERTLDGILLTHPGDLAYLSDFSGHDSIGVLTADDFILVTDFRYTEQAQIEAPWLKTILRDGKMSDALLAAFDQLKATAYGFESNFTTFGQVEGLRKAIAEKKLAYAVHPVDDLMVNVRKVKDEVEIQVIRDAVKVAQDAMLDLKPFMKPGITENELAGRLVFEMRKRGASDASFEPIIATGPASSLPHYRPGDIPTKSDTFLLTDWGARYQGYCSDITRTWAIGKIADKLKEIYAVCLDAQLAAIAAIKPGVTNKSVDAIARGIIEQAGYGQYFGHGLGHGIGRDIHEQPTLRKTGPDEELKPGMIVTVEPGIYLPGVGGVRIEDDVLITAAGHEVLTSLPKSLQDCTL